MQNKPRAPDVLKSEVTVYMHLIPESQQLVGH